MRISPIFAKTSKSNMAVKGQGARKINYGTAHSYFANNEIKNDIFMRLAEASIRDSKIECELKSMGLI